MRRAPLRTGNPGGSACRSASPRAIHQAHAYSPLRSERDRGVRLYPLARSEIHPEPLSQRGQEKVCLHHSETRADTLSGAPPEGEIREARQRLRVLGGPAIRVEPFRVLVVTGITLHHPPAHQRRGTGRHPVAADLALALSRILGMVFEELSVADEPYAFRSALPTCTAWSQR